MAIPQNIAISITENISIIQNQLSSPQPDIAKVVEAVGFFESVKKELADFAVKTKDQVKSQGSKAMATAILSGVAYVLFWGIKWISIMTGIPFP